MIYYTYVCPPPDCIDVCLAKSYYSKGAPRTGFRSARGVCGELLYQRTVILEQGYRGYEPRWLL